MFIYTLSIVQNYLRKIFTLISMYSISHNFPQGSILSKRSRNKVILFTATVVGPLIAIMLSISGATAFIVFLSFLVSLFTWFMWHIFAIKIADFILRKHAKKQELCFLTENPQIREVSLKSLLKLSIFALFFLFSSSTLVLSILDYTNTLHYLFLRKPDSALNLIVDVFLLSFFLWPFFSIFVVPVKSLFEGSDFRIVDYEQKTVTEVQVNPLLEDFIGLSVGYSFILQVIMADTLVNAIVYLIVLFIALFPPAFILALMYSLISYPRHIVRLYRKFTSKIPILSQ